MEKLVNLLNSLLSNSKIEDEEDRVDFIASFFQDMCDCMLDQIILMPQYEDLVPQINKKMHDENASDEEKIAYVDEIIGSISSEDGHLILTRAIQIIILRNLLNLIDSHKLTLQGFNNFIREYKANEFYYQGHE